MARFELVCVDDLPADCRESFASDNSFAAVVENMPDGSQRFVGCDGGSPEDQFLGRDWSWVIHELNAAYEAGKAGA